MDIVIEVVKMIIAVSDLHLGSQLANKPGFSDFIREFLQPNQDEISHLILLGDILDLWRNKNSQVLLQNLDILEAIGRLDIMKNYIVGNHDYAIFSLLSNPDSEHISPESKGILDHVSETLDLTNNGLNLKFIHGHQIDYWPALSFYEIFSEAMCFVDIEDQELSDVWNIIYRFAEKLPEKTRNRVRNLAKETQSALEQMLASPLDGNAQEKKSEFFSEWQLLSKISDFDDVANRSFKPLSDIEKFAEEWERILKSIDYYHKAKIQPQHLADKVHQKRREAATLTVGLQEDQFLIRAHGHSPYVSEKSEVADTGCWLGAKGSYLKIQDGKVTVHQW